MHIYIIILFHICKKWIIESLEVIKLARPRVIRTDSGAELILKNVDATIADKIKALLEGTNTSDLASSETLPEEETMVEYKHEEKSMGETKTSMNEVALGTFKAKDGCWCVATIRFNPETNLAVVDSVTRAGMETLDVQERYKIMSAELGLV